MLGNTGSLNPKPALLTTIQHYLKKKYYAILYLHFIWCYNHDIIFFNHTGSSADDELERNKTEHRRVLEASKREMISTRTKSVVMREENKLTSYWGRIDNTSQVTRRESEGKGKLNTLPPERPGYRAFLQLKI